MKPAIRLLAPAGSQSCRACASSCRRWRTDAGPPLPALTGASLQFRGPRTPTTPRASGSRSSYSIAATANVPGLAESSIASGSERTSPSATCIVPDDNQMSGGPVKVKKKGQAVEKVVQSNGESSSSDNPSTSITPARDPLYPISKSHTELLKPVVELWARQIPLLNDVDVYNVRLEAAVPERSPKLQQKRLSELKSISSALDEAKDRYNDLRSTLGLPPVLKLDDAVAAAKSEPSLRSPRISLQCAQTKAVSTLAGAREEVRKLSESDTSKGAIQTLSTIKAGTVDCSVESAAEQVGPVERHANALRQALELSANERLLNRAVQYCKGRLQNLSPSSPKGQRMQTRRVILSKAVQATQQERAKLVEQILQLRAELRLGPIKTNFEGLVAAALDGDASLAAFAQGHADYLAKKTTLESFEAIKIEGQKIVDFGRTMPNKESTEEPSSETDATSTTKSVQASTPTVTSQATTKIQTAGAAAVNPVAEELIVLPTVPKSVIPLAISTTTKHRSALNSGAALQVATAPQQTFAPPATLSKARLLVNELQTRTPATRLGKWLTAATKAVDADNAAFVTSHEAQAASGVGIIERLRFWAIRVLAPDSSFASPVSVKEHNLFHEWLHTALEGPLENKIVRKDWPPPGVKIQSLEGSPQGVDASCSSHDLYQAHPDWTCLYSDGSYNKIVNAAGAGMYSDDLTFFARLPLACAGSFASEIAAMLMALKSLSPNSMIKPSPALHNAAQAVIFTDSQALVGLLASPAPKCGDPVHAKLCQLCRDELDALSLQRRHVVISWTPGNSQASRRVPGNRLADALAGLGTQMWFRDEHKRLQAMKQSGTV